MKKTERTEEERRNPRRHSAFDGILSEFWLMEFDPPSILETSINTILGSQNNNPSLHEMKKQKQIKPLKTKDKSHTYLIWWYSLVLTKQPTSTPNPAPFNPPSPPAHLDLSTSSFPSTLGPPPPLTISLIPTIPTTTMLTTTMSLTILTTTPSFFSSGRWITWFTENHSVH